MTLQQINMFHHQYPREAVIWSITQSQNGILVGLGTITCPALWDGQYWQEYKFDEPEMNTGEILGVVDN